MPDLTLSARFMPESPTPRVRFLVLHSVERILAKSGDPADLIRRFGTGPLRHIIDWLVVADQQDAEWIRHTNTQGVPLKLAKCGCLNRLRTEADKAMRREAQRSLARLGEKQKS